MIFGLELSQSLYFTVLNHEIWSRIAFPAQSQGPFHRVNPDCSDLPRPATF